MLIKVSQNILHWQYVMFFFFLRFLCLFMCIIFVAMMTYLNSVHGLQFPPDQHWFCCIATTVLWASTLSSTLFILSMTFDRVYSIIRPHKAASFNTVKRAKTTIVSIIIFSCLFNIPYLFVVTNDGFECVALLNKFGEKLFFWVSYLVQFIVPFVSLLSMNSILVHTLRKRYLQQIASVEAQCYNQVFSQLNSEGQGQGHGQIFKYKHTDRQVCVIPLLVAFSFFVLISPLYAFLLYIETVDFTKSPAAFAEFFLFYQVMHKMYYTNNAINFFLYVISGRKFRRDLVNLFRWNVKWNVVHSK